MILAALYTLRVLLRPMHFRWFLDRSPLAAHVLHVLLMRTKEKVRRVEASPVVAGVADMKPASDRAAKGRIGNTMRRQQHPLSVAPGAELAVPSHRVPGAGPLPASINSLKRTCSVLNPALGRTVELDAGPSLEAGSTGLADPVNATRLGVFCHAAIIAKSRASYYRETAEQIAARL
jgi:hypothetical protein